jgi:hypothetical protein
VKGTRRAGDIDGRSEGRPTGRKANPEILVSSPS